MKLLPIAVQYRISDSYSVIDRAVPCWFCRFDISQPDPSKRLAQAANQRFYPKKRTPRKNIWYLCKGTVILVLKIFLFRTVLNAHLLFSEKPAAVSRYFCIILRNDPKMYSLTDCRMLSFSDYLYMVSIAYK